MKDHPHRAGRYDWITFLVTGPEEKLKAWQHEAMFVIELFDRRGQTIRCRAHGDGPTGLVGETDRGQGAYDAAVELAKRFDVTLQDLVHKDEEEEYPIVHLGTHGMKWPNERAEVRTKKPWPGDAIMIVASPAGQENRANMETPTPAECRDCGCALMACSFSIRTAEQMPVRRGRPIKFFCTTCCINYGLEGVQISDHAGVTGRIIP